MYKLKSHKVQTLQSSVRIEAYCRGLFKELPSNKSVKKAVIKGGIRVKGCEISSAYFVKENDEVELWDLEESAPSPYKLKIDVVYEDDYLAVVFKPAGLVTSGNVYRTLENAIQGQLKHCENNPLKWAKPVHRLDGPTSGLVIIAKSIDARIKLGRMLEQKQIDKTYCALLSGDLKGDQTIDLPIDGKNAISQISLKRKKESLNNGFVSKVFMKPITGRTHQLRRHAAALGLPIIGDKEYGENGNTLLHKGLFLCSFQLKFIHPITGANLNIKADIPKKFNKLMIREYERYLKFNK